jgi:hypothetical protein
LDGAPFTLHFGGGFCIKRRRKEDAEVTNAAAKLRQIRGTYYFSYLFYCAIYFAIDLNQILCVLDFRWILSPSLRITEEGRRKEGQNLLLDLSPN